jgi:hypothetical protein
LKWKRSDYVRERIVSQPGRTVISRRARPHSIARCAGARRLATRSCPLSLVIPDGEEAAIRIDRNIRLPLGLGRIGVGVKLERSAEGNSPIGGANVEDIARVTGGSVAGGIDVVNDTVERGRLAPTHVSPVRRVVEHGGEVA